MSLLLLECSPPEEVPREAIINSIGKARENSIVKKDMKKIKKMLKFFLEIIIKEELLDDRNRYVHNNKNLQKINKSTVNVEGKLVPAVRQKVNLFYKRLNRQGKPDLLSGKILLYK